MPLLLIMPRSGRVECRNRENSGQPVSVPRIEVPGRWDETPVSIGRATAGRVGYNRCGRSRHADPRLDPRDRRDLARVSLELDFGDPARAQCRPAPAELLRPG